MARILVVDDDADLLKSLSMRLRYEGHDVTSADGGPMALAKLDLEVPHMVITDLRMPEMDGLQLFEAIHRRFPLMPVVILTANGTIPDAVRAMQKGVFGYITKPFEGVALMREVDRAQPTALRRSPRARGARPSEARA